MKKQALEQKKIELTELRNRLQVELGSHAQAVSEQVQSTGDVSDLPTHNADHDVEGLETEIATGTVQRETLKEVEAALDRLAEGSYGTCTSCGGPIVAERLDALPYTPVCVDCERKREAEEGGE